MTYSHLHIVDKFIKCIKLHLFYVFKFCVISHERSVKGQSTFARIPHVITKWNWFSDSSIAVIYALDLRHIDGILPKRPYSPCFRMEDRGRLAGYPRYIRCWIIKLWPPLQKSHTWKMLTTGLRSICSWKRYKRRWQALTGHVINTSYPVDNVLPLGLWDVPGNFQSYLAYFEEIAPNSKLIW